MLAAAAAAPADAPERFPTVAEVEHLRRASIDASCVATLRRLADEIRALPPTAVAEVRAALAAVAAPGVR
jgi:hypothetical protein